MAKLGALLTVALLALVGVTVVMVTRRESDPRFDTNQRSPERVLAKAVEDAVRQAPETKNGPPGSSARCTPGGITQLRNPWNCRIVYPSGTNRIYNVIVAADESYFAKSVGTAAVVKGCCVRFTQ